ncbi:MAG: S9 family peptidase [Proteobacteria bacterium]|nr:S9 family peptidase [Pseudomonadota bacterium]
MKIKIKLDALDVFSGTLQPSFPQLDGDRLYWLQAVLERAGAAGLYVLDLAVTDSKPRLISPEGSEPNSKVHEYGGSSYLANGEHVYFANAADQQIYRLSVGSGELRQLTDDKRLRYSDFLLVAHGSYLFCIAERIVGGINNEAMIVALALQGVNDITQPITLAKGADFYAGLAVDVQSKQLAWFEWNHPNMPWDSTRLMLSGVSIKPEPLLHNPRVLIDSPVASVCQPHFAVDGALVFAMDGVVSDLDGPLEEDCTGDITSDALDSWQILCWKDNKLERLTRDDAEYGGPFWVFGEHRIVNFNGQLAAISSLNGQDDIVEVGDSDTNCNNNSSVGNTDVFDVVQQLLADENAERLLALAGSAVQPLGIWCFSKSDDDTQGAWKKIVGSAPLLEEKFISRPQHFVFPTRDGEQAYAFYYPPSNGRAAAHEAAPTLVMVHGGPTAQAKSLYDPMKQFWTTRGYAVLDVNHRGSTGYGREFRQSLLGRWGLRDVDDVMDAIEFAVEQGWAARERLFVRGKSAGGYAVLRLLTEYGEYFAAGASYYGIGDLAILAEDTHKFESHYLDGLLGQKYDPQKATQPGNPYYDRSPVHTLDKIRCPVIIFQGAEDTVVPPVLAHSLVAALEKQGIRHEYVEYSCEGHGFRNPKNSSDALERELAFYGQALFGNDASSADGM